ncbi:MAG: YceI family protein [Chloroflexi bacterium]|nr:MAG: YceI family protein [Chloroflexota bacterium]
MQKLTVLLILITFVLTACSGTSSQVTETEEIPGTGPENSPVTTTEPSAGATQESDAVSTVQPDANDTQEGMGSPVEMAGENVTYAFVDEESFITYEVGETFIDRGNVFNVASGTTQGVDGEIVLNFDQPQESRVGTLTADISGFRSDNQRRDNAIRDRFLQSVQFPTVTFTPTDIMGLPEVGEPGVEYPITIEGDLTIRDVTKHVVFDTVVMWEADELHGQAVATFLMSDFGFGPIEIFGILATEDEVKVTVDFTARPE